MHMIVHLVSSFFDCHNSSEVLIAVSVKSAVL
jgi:hypothetical protein